MLNHINKYFIKLKTNKIIILILITCLILLNTISTLNIDANTQNINLAISKSVKNDDDIDNSQVDGVWQATEVLNKNDAIKYRWDNVKLDTAYKDNPISNGGFLRVYLDDDMSAENFLIITGANEYPLKISRFADRLKEGENTLLFVYVDNTLKQTDNRVFFKFDYKQESEKPTIEIIKPRPNTVFSSSVKQNIELEIENFELSSLRAGKTDTGRLNIYLNNKSKVLTSISSASSISNNKSTVEILSDAISGFDNVVDSRNTRLIFELVNGLGETVAEESIEITTNYNNSLEVGLPKVEITEPKVYSSDVEVNGLTKFWLDIENFNIINSKLKDINEDSEIISGYLQILIDNTPIQTMWHKNEFTLSEIGYDMKKNGRVEIGVQLINQDYTKLQPEVNDSIVVNYKNISDSGELEEVSRVESNQWKIIVIALTVILILGTILISISNS